MGAAFDICLRRQTINGGRSFFYQALLHTKYQKGQGLGMHNKLMQKWQAIKLITRMDKPIGTYLLLWPTYWALWIASDGWPNFYLLICI